MNDFNETQRIEIDGWTFRIRESSTSLEKARMLLLLHGHLGNENVMWILTKSIPKSYTIIAPRAPVKMGPQQYSWHKIDAGWPDLDAYQQIASQLLNRINKIIQTNRISDQSFDVMGFSQGASMAYALAILHSDRIGRIAALAGFIPNSWKAQIHQSKLNRKEFYIAHGLKDDIIPIEKARNAANLLKQEGAQVTYCEANIGHKIGVDCFKGLGKFFGKKN